MVEAKDHTQGIYAGHRPLITEEFKCMLIHGNKTLFVENSEERKRQKSPGGKVTNNWKKGETNFMPASFLTN